LRRAAQSRRSAVTQAHLCTTAAPQQVRIDAEGVGHAARRVAGSRTDTRSLRNGQCAGGGVDCAAPLLSAGCGLAAVATAVHRHTRALAVHHAHMTMHARY